MPDRSRSESKKAIREREQARTQMAKELGTYGDNNYAGRGVILCARCAQPLRDHKVIGPCTNPPADSATRAELIGNARYGRRVPMGERD